MAGRQKRNRSLAGWPAAPEPVGQVELRFRPEYQVERVFEPVRQDISAAALVERTLFLGSDEGAAVERLATEDWKTFESHQPILLGDFFDLPDGPLGEMDIEGLAADDGFLWVVGSHSLTRDKPKRDENTGAAAIAELTDIDRDSNRYFLGRIPIVRQHDGNLTLAAAGAPDEESEGPGDRTTRTAACLKMKDGGNALTAALADDVHLGPFLRIPSKENGLDVEGIAVHGNRVALGLRGPVLRGWACILELHVKQTKPHRLKARKIGAGGERYRKHFVYLDGLGIRDLRLDGADLLILAGPTMDLDGPAAVYRWPDWLGLDGPELLHPKRLEKVTDLPFGHGTDHPEAIVLWPGGRRRHRLLVICDNPADHRLESDDNAVLADIFAIAGSER